MRRLLKSWVFWAFVALPLGATIVYFTHHEKDHYACGGCDSAQLRSQWRFGLWKSWSFALSPEFEKTDESRFSIDFPAPHHLHAWEFQRGSPYYLFGTLWGGCSGGKGVVLNIPLSCYESDPSFAAFLKGKIDRGEVSRAEVVAAMTDTSRTNSGDAWVMEYSLSRPRR